MAKAYYVFLMDKSLRELSRRIWSKVRASFMPTLAESSMESGGKTISKRL